jgi:hypothetical protein
MSSSVRNISTLSGPSLPRPLSFPWFFFATSAGSPERQHQTDRAEPPRLGGGAVLHAGAAHRVIDPKLADAVLGQPLHERQHWDPRLLVLLYANQQRLDVVEDHHVGLQRGAQPFASRTDRHSSASQRIKIFPIWAPVGCGSEPIALPALDHADRLPEDTERRNKGKPNAR